MADATPDTGVRGRGVVGRDEGDIFLGGDGAVGVVERDKVNRGGRDE